MSFTRPALRQLRRCIERPDGLRSLSVGRRAHTLSGAGRRTGEAPHGSTRPAATRVSRWMPTRSFSASARQQHGHLDPPKAGEELHVTIVDQAGNKHAFEVAAGDNLLDVAQANDLEMEGACGGSCACSTCHVIVEDDAMFDRMPEAEDDENDMLDLAFGLTETSRLGCQIKMTKELDGLVVRLPSATRNLQKSDFEKK